MHDPPHRDDDALLAELTAAPSVEEARESYDYWRERAASLPRHRVAQRREARQQAVVWKQRLTEAERRRHGPGLVEQLLVALGVRWRPEPRRLLFGATALLTIIMVLVIAVLVAVVAFWPELEPIVRTLLNSGGDG